MWFEFGVLLVVLVVGLAPPWTVLLLRLRRIEALMESTAAELEEQIATAVEAAVKRLDDRVEKRLERRYTDNGATEERQYEPAQSGVRPGMPMRRNRGP